MKRTPIPIQVPSEPIVRWPQRSWRGSPQHRPEGASLLPTATPGKEPSRYIGEFTVDWELASPVDENQ